MMKIFIITTINRDYFKDYGYEEICDDGYNGEHDDYHYITDGDGNVGNMIIKLMVSFDDGNVGEDNDDQAHCTPSGLP